MSKSLAIFSGLAVIALEATSCATARSEPPVNERGQALLDSLEPTGEMISCISARRVERIVPVTEELFLIEAGGNKVYLSQVRGKCTGATRRTNRLQYTLPTGQLCSNEIITVVDNNIGALSGTCSLGEFQEMVKKPTDDEAVE